MTKKEIEVQDALGLLYKWSYCLIMYTSEEARALSKSTLHSLKAFSSDRKRFVETTLSVFAQELARTLPRYTHYRLFRYAYASTLNGEPIEAMLADVKDTYIWIHGNDPQDFVVVGKYN